MFRVLAVLSAAALALAGCGSRQGTATTSPATTLEQCTALFNDWPHPGGRFQMFLDHGGVTFGEHPRVRVSLEWQGGVGDAPGDPNCVVTLGYARHPDLTVIFLETHPSPGYGAVMTNQPRGTTGWRLGEEAVRNPNAKLVHGRLALSGA